MDDDLHFLAKDPRNREPHIFFTSQESNVLGVGMMYRVLDKEGFIRKLDHNFNGVSLNVRFNVVDSFLLSNHGSLVVHFEGGKPVLGGVRLRCGGFLERGVVQQPGDGCG